MLQDTRLAIIVNPELTPGHLANTIAAICIGIGSAMPGLGNQRLTDSRQNTIDISSNRPVPILQADGATIRALLLKALPKKTIVSSCRFQPSRVRCTAMPTTRRNFRNGISRRRRSTASVLPAT